MKQIKKLAACLLAVCLAAGTLCVSASAAGTSSTVWDGSFPFTDLTAEETDNLIIRFSDVVLLYELGQMTGDSPTEMLRILNEKEDEYGNSAYDILYVYELGLMNGTSPTTFSPDGFCTRAMMWAVLARMNGVEVSGSGWVEQARAWAMENGVSDGTYPDREITCQELVTMLYNIAGQPAISTDDLSLDLYLESEQTASWAQDAMRWAIKTNVCHFGESISHPNAPVTRSEIASFMVRFYALTTNEWDYVPVGWNSYLALAMGWR